MGQRTKGKAAVLQAPGSRPARGLPANSGSKAPSGMTDSAPAAAGASAFMFCRAIAVFRLV